MVGTPYLLTSVPLDTYKWNHLLEHTRTRLPEMIQVFKCTNIKSGSKTVLIHTSTESRTEFSTRLSQLESVLVQSCQRGVPPEAVSKRNDSFGVSKFASKENTDSPSGYTLPLVHHLHRPYKWFFSNESTK